MKPLEFKIENNLVAWGENEESYLSIRFYYEDGTSEVVELDYHCDLPKGLELNKHYSIGDLYGYKVIDDRKGL